jgi:hypothetical protein
MERCTARAWADEVALAHRRVAGERRHGEIGLRVQVDEVLHARNGYRSAVVDHRGLANWLCPARPAQEHHHVTGDVLGRVRADVVLDQLDEQVRDVKRCGRHGPERKPRRAMASTTNTPRITPPAACPTSALAAAAASYRSRPQTGVGIFSSSALSSVWRS